MEAKNKLSLARVLIGEDKSEYLYVKTRVYVAFLRSLDISKRLEADPH